MENSSSSGGTNGQARWDTAVLTRVLKELGREFPNYSPERLARAVDEAARAVHPSTGPVALAQRARALLSTGK